MLCRLFVDGVNNCFCGGIYIKWVRIDTKSVIDNDQISQKLHD